MKINFFFILLLATYTTILQAWPPSLQNCDSTCFLNATIQILYNTPPLTKHIIETEPAAQNNAVDSYAKLIAEFEKSKEALMPKQFDCKGPLDTFVKSIQALNFNVCGRQEDAIEFMRAFLNQLKQAFPMINQFYESNETSLVTCPQTQILPYEESQTSFPIDVFELPVEIEKTIDNKSEYIPIKSLESCVSSYFHTQELEEYHGRKDCLKTLWIENSKEILFISLRRFRYEKETKKRLKLSHTISIPLELNINAYLKNPNQSYDYELIGAIVQSGTLEGGHYWAYVKELPDEWYKCDDAAITKVSATGNHMIEEINGKPNGPTGYLFVYQKKSKRAEFIKKEQERKKHEQQMSTLFTNLKNLTSSLQNLEKKLSGNF